jgi:hypothetical protein
MEYTLDTIPNTEALKIPEYVLWLGFSELKRQRRIGRSSMIDQRKSDTLDGNKPKSRKIY